MQSHRKDLHATLVRCMQREAYPVSEKGVCAGWVMMGVRAYFNKTLTCFKELTQTFLQQTPLTLNQRAFLDGIELYQQPEKHAAWFVKPVSALSTDAITELTADEYIEESSGLVTLHCTMGAYSRMQLMHYFYQLEKEVRAVKKSFAITIATTTHRVALCYDVERAAWLALDINQWPPTLFKKLESAAFFKWLVFAFNESFPINLVHKYHCLQQDRKQFVSLMASTSGQGSILPTEKLLALAARYGHIPTLQRLQAQGMNFNQILNDEWTAVMLAAESGELAALKWLAAQGANLNATLPNGGGALFVAAQMGHVDVVNWLLTQNVNSASGMTLKSAQWLEFAKHYDVYQPILQQLQQKGVANLMQQEVTLSPYEIAVVLERKEVANLLQQSQLGLFADAKAPSGKKERPQMAYSHYTSKCKIAF